MTEDIDVNSFVEDLLIVFDTAVQNIPTDKPGAGEWECSRAFLNRLQHNDFHVINSELGNHLLMIQYLNQIELILQDNESSDRNKYKEIVIQSSLMLIEDKLPKHMDNGDDEIISKGLNCVLRIINHLSHILNMVFPNNQLVVTLSQKANSFMSKFYLGIVKFQLQLLQEEKYGQNDSIIKQVCIVLTKLNQMVKNHTYLLQILSAHGDMLRSCLNNLTQLLYKSYDEPDSIGHFFNDTTLICSCEAINEVANVMMMSTNGLDRLEVVSSYLTLVFSASFESDMEASAQMDIINVLVPAILKALDPMEMGYYFVNLGISYSSSISCPYWDLLEFWQHCRFVLSNTKLNKEDENKIMVALQNSFNFMNRLCYLFEMDKHAPCFEKDDEGCQTEDPLYRVSKEFEDATTPYLNLMVILLDLLTVLSTDQRLNVRVVESLLILLHRIVDVNNRWNDKFTSFLLQSDKTLMELLLKLLRNHYQVSCGLTASICGLLSNAINNNFSSTDNNIICISTFNQNMQLQRLFADIMSFFNIDDNKYLLLSVEGECGNKDSFMRILYGSILQLYECLLPRTKLSNMAVEDVIQELHHLYQVSIVCLSNVDMEQRVLYIIIVWWMILMASLIERRVPFEGYFADELSSTSNDDKSDDCKLSCIEDEKRKYFIVYWILNDSTVDNRCDLEIILSVFCRTMDDVCCSPTGLYPLLSSLLEGSSLGYRNLTALANVRIMESSMMGQLLAAFELGVNTYYCYEERFGLSSLEYAVSKDDLICALFVVFENIDCPDAFIHQMVIQTPNIIPLLLNMIGFKDGLYWYDERNKCQIYQILHKISTVDAVSVRNAFDNIEHVGERWCCLLEALVDVPESVIAPVCLMLVNITASPSSGDLRFGSLQSRLLHGRDNPEMFEIDESLPWKGLEVLGTLFQKHLSQSDSHVPAMICKIIYNCFSFGTTEHYPDCIFASNLPEKLISALAEVSRVCQLEMALTILKLLHLLFTRARSIQSHSDYAIHSWISMHLEVTAHVESCKNI